VHALHAPVAENGLETFIASETIERELLGAAFSVVLVLDAKRPAAVL
jgi:hypothetical protein